MSIFNKLFKFNKKKLQQSKLEYHLDDMTFVFEYDDNGNETKQTIKYNNEEVEMSSENLILLNTEGFDSVKELRDTLIESKLITELYQCKIDRGISNLSDYVELRVKPKKIDKSIEKEAQETVRMCFEIIMIYNQINERYNKLKYIKNSNEKYIGFERLDINTIIGLDDDWDWFHVVGYCMMIAQGKVTYWDACEEIPLLDQLSSNRLLCRPLGIVYEDC